MSERSTGGASGAGGAGDVEHQSEVPQFSVPNAEKYVLEADTLRRRQLRSALLHGSRRTWRAHLRLWPAVVVGVIVVAVVVAAMAVAIVLRDAQEDDEGEATPAATATVRATDRAAGDTAL